MNKDFPALHEMHDWQGYEVTHHAIGRALGVFTQDFQDTPNTGPIFYTDNVLSASLERLAEELVRIGYLEQDPSKPCYRLKAGFDAQALGATWVGDDPNRR